MLFFIGSYHARFKRIYQQSDARVENTWINDNHLTATHNSIVYKLEHYHYDIFIEFELGDEPQLISFLIDTNGDITRLNFPLEPAVKDNLFTRISDSIGC
jgi:hypothetical protein